MKHQLKYLKLFEGLSPEEIPYSEVHDDGTMSIIIPKNVKELPPVFNELTDEVTWTLIINSNQSLTEVNWFNNLTWVGGYLSIKNNKFLTEVTGFDNLTWVGRNLSIYNNESLTEVTGFDSLIEIGRDLWIRNNPTLVAMSIPGSLVRSVDYLEYGIYYDDEYFISPPEFINSPVVIDDLVSKLNPGYHSTQVGVQIWENLKEWGTQSTIDTIISRLTMEQLNILPDEFKHLNHPDYKSTSVRDVAKLNTGQIYGIF